MQWGPALQERQISLGAGSPHYGNTRHDAESLHTTALQPPWTVVTWAGAPFRAGGGLLHVSVSCYSMPKMFKRNLDQYLLINLGTNFQMELFCGQKTLSSLYELLVYYCSS